MFWRLHIIPLCPLEANSPASVRSCLRHHSCCRIWSPDEGLTLLSLDMPYRSPSSRVVMVRALFRGGCVSPLVSQGYL